MKILCEFASSGPYFVRLGWSRVASYCGHTWTWWDPTKQSAFDAFSEFEPDAFLGTSYGIDRAVYKNIVKRPNMKVGLFCSAWGEAVRDIDLKKYPVVVTSDEEKKTIERLRREVQKPDFIFIHASAKRIHNVLGGWAELGVPYASVPNGADLFSYFRGQPKKELSCSIGYCGGYWSYKARNLDRYILPLCEQAKVLNVKIFGNNWPVAQFLGGISQEDERDLYASATISPTIHEPHSSELPGYGDFVERFHKVSSSGGFGISDPCEDAREFYSLDELVMTDNPKDFHDAVMYFLAHPDERLPFMKKAHERAVYEHSYFERVAAIFNGLELPAEADKVVRAKARFLSEGISQ